jgi:hypothetical protein
MELEIIMLNKISRLRKTNITFSLMCRIQTGEKKKTKQK